jgi:hypothetical protein
MQHDTLTKLGEFAIKQRRRFDPSNAEDLRAFAYFRKNSKWLTGCPFFLEWPYHDVIVMCQSKYTDYMLTRLPKSKQRK